MKKQVVASLAAAMVLGVAGTSFAAVSNPFVDVPAKSWAYDAVTQLARDGVVDGYSNGTFQGDKTITRYEMAQIVARAMAREDKADAKDKVLINKLSVEFASELEALNVRVTNVENRLDNVKWGGEFRERYDHVKQDSVTSNTSGSHSYVDMWATAQINPDWVGKVEYESTEIMNNNPANPAATDRAGAKVDGASTTRAYVQGKLFGAQATIGKFDPFVGYGLVIDDSMTGGMLQFGNKLQARVALGKYAGNIDSTNVDPGAVSFATSPSYGFAELDLAASKATNFKFAYHTLGDLNDATVGAAAGSIAAGLPNSIHYTEAGLDTKIGKDFSLMGSYSKTNYDVDSTGYNTDSTKNRGYFTQLTYKASDLQTVGSYDLFVNYRNVPVLTQLDSTWDYVRGMKGTEFGVEYVPALNTKITAFYLAGKDLTNTSGGFLTSNQDDPKDNVFRTQVEFFF